MKFVFNMELEVTEKEIELLNSLGKETLEQLMKMSTSTVVKEDTDVEINVDKE